ncbi:MAG: HD domain-containing protein [Ruminococcus sp.]|nr:HD domain-containing protein [Ruminococcus sp.]
MIYTELTNKAMRIAYEAHHGQYDVNGVPYIFHPYHVAEQMTDEITTCVALLHDVIEDTDITIEELEQVFPAEVTEPVRLLTHEKGTEYIDYIEKIKTNPVARTVKLADIAHNSDMSRITDLNAVPAEKIIRWKRKYTEAKRILEKYQG